MLCTERAEGEAASRRNTLYLAVPASAEGVSVAGDWSSVRVWFAPSGGLGGRTNPTYGFIYANASAATASPGALTKSTVPANIAAPSPLDRG